MLYKLQSLLIQLHVVVTYQLLSSMDYHSAIHDHSFYIVSFWWAHTTGAWIIFSAFTYITITIWIWTFWITAIYSCHFYTSGLADAGQRPNTLTAQYAEYILNFETLGSADFIPNRKTLSDNALAFLHFDLFISLE